MQSGGRLQLQFGAPPNWNIVLYYIKKAYMSQLQIVWTLSSDSQIDKPGLLLLLLFMLNEKQKINKIMRLGVELAEVKDVDVLLERILREARKLVTADAGSIYITRNDSRPGKN